MTDYQCCYIIDSSSLFNLKKWNPRDLYPTVWGKLERQINDGLLLSPIEVKKEIAVGDDELTEWASENHNMFRELDDEQIRLVSTILTKYPELVQADKETPDADPFIIALASKKDKQRTLELTEKRKVVLTEEKLKGDKINIPFVCSKLGIDCINIHEMFRREGWSF